MILIERHIVGGEHIAFCDLMLLNDKSLNNVTDLFPGKVVKKVIRNKQLIDNPPIGLVLSIHEQNSKLEILSFLN